jgi:hypothetical protein
LTEYGRPVRTVVVLAIAVIALVFIVNNRSGDDEDTTTEATDSPATTTEATVPLEPTTEPKPSREERAQELMAKLSPGQVAELKAKLSREQLRELKREANTEAKLSREQLRELKRVANDWASLFATDACNRYTGQPICERLRVPVLPAFKKSFADATIEDIKSERITLVGWADRPYYLAAVKFSNGEVVVFGGVPGVPPARSCAGAGSGCVWNIGEVEHNRRFLEAARE